MIKILLKSTKSCLWLPIVSFKEREHSEDIGIGVYRRIILKWDREKWRALLNMATNIRIS